MPKFKVTHKDETHEIEAEDAQAAKKALYELKGVKRLNGVTVTEASKGKSKSKPDWRELPKPDLAEFLLEHATIADSAWTEKSREKGEKREQFIERVLLGKKSG